MTPRRVRSRTATDSPVKPRNETHPARFSQAVIDAVAVILADIDTNVRPAPKMFDPYAGTLERLHSTFTPLGWNVFGCDIEQWKDMHENVIHGDCVEVMAGMAMDGEKVRVVFSSPTYGNRMGDQSMLPDRGAGLKHTYNTYAYRLGKRLDPLNTGRTQWDNKTGRSYRRLHRRGWAGAWEILEDGGLLIVNVSDHIRRGEVMKVVDWHRAAITEIAGSEPIVDVVVDTPRNRQGANREARVDGEHVMVWHKG